MLHDRENMPDAKYRLAINLGISRWKQISYSCRVNSPPPEVYRQNTKRGNNKTRDQSYFLIYKETRTDKQKDVDIRRLQQNKNSKSKGAEYDIPYPPSLNPAKKMIEREKEHTQHETFCLKYPAHEY